jgi:hypothetical protein
MKDAFGTNDLLTRSPRYRAAMKVLVLTALLGCSAGPAVELPGPSADAVRIARITRSLLPPVRVRGEDVRFALEARMRTYHVHGASIAVFDHYLSTRNGARLFGHGDAKTGDRRREFATPCRLRGPR